jgi:hypothetical protein
MFTASFYFLGLAASIVGALCCLKLGRHSGKCVEVELDALRAVSVCLPTGRRPTDTAITAMYKELTWDEKAKLSDMKAIWMGWYERCRRKAFLKQKALYSWARTLSLCAMLCLMGVLLEAEFNQPITIRTILAGFRRPSLDTTCAVEAPRLPPSPSMQAPADSRSARK